MHYASITIYLPVPALTVAIRLIFHVLASARFAVHIQTGVHIALNYAPTDYERTTKLSDAIRESIADTNGMLYKKLAEKKVQIVNSSVISICRHSNIVLTLVQPHRALQTSDLP
jgi:hypothetical protein